MNFTPNKVPYNFIAFKLFFWLFAIILSVFFFSCTPEKKLAEGEYLLVKNKIQVDKKIPIADNLVYVVRPQTNKRTFGLFLLKVSVYQAMQPQSQDSLVLQKKMERRTKYGKYPAIWDTLTGDYYVKKYTDFKNWMQKNFGEEPVLLDTSLIAYSVAQLKLMMANNGYFQAEVQPTIKYDEKRAKVHYKIFSGEPYRINEILYRIEDTTIANFILLDTNRRNFKCGDIYAVKNLEEEQKRLSNRMQNMGYFYFSQNFIRFEIDSNFNNNSLSITIIVDNPQYQINDTTFVAGKHRRFQVESVTIYSDFSDWNEVEVIPQTVYYVEKPKNQDTALYVIHYNQGRNFRSKTLTYPIFFRPGSLYSALRSRITYDCYVDMKNFDFVKISYTETQQSKENFMSDTGLLDCKIQLNRSKRRNFDVDLLLKNTGARIAFGGNFTFMNRNLFKGGEILSFALKYTHELQTDSTGTYFKNFELGGTIGLEVPYFWFPIRQENIPKAFRPKTTIQIGVNYMRQDLYDRFLTNIAYTYRWRMRYAKNRNVAIENSLSILDFNLIKMYTDENFEEAISQYRFTRRILEKYKDHFILGSVYNFSVQNPNKYILNTKVDLYGNLMYAFMTALGKYSEKYKNDFRQYTLWKIPFACGITLDIDYVHSLFKQKKQTLVFHSNVGIGVPLLNSNSLPFEKSFYLGGSNSMRGWRIRTLGPGGYVDTSSTTLTIESLGDIKLELNLEYRFPIYKVLNAALFADVGNIWLLKKTANYPHGEFTFNRFYKELAIDAGIGIRLDLSFFVIRLDYAWKIHNPAKIGVDAWQHFKWNSYQGYKLDRSIVLGIGYPF